MAGGIDGRQSVAENRKGGAVDFESRPVCDGVNPEGESTDDNNTLARKFAGEQMCYFLSVSGWATRADNRDSWPALFGERTTIKYSLWWLGNMNQW